MWSISSSARLIPTNCASRGKRTGSAWSAWRKRIKFRRTSSSTTVSSRKSFATKTLDQQPRELPELRLDHLSRMTDSTGIFQHAIFTVPNFSEGYCTDDNARAFILTVLLDQLEEEPQRIRALATTY